MNEKPFVSVVIPTFNRSRQVQAALSSVFAQTYREFEVIVVDDGSTDGTESALQAWLGAQGSNGEQVRYFLQPNQGQSGARNRGVKEARGEWIAFLDSDDVWLPEKLELQVEAIKHFEGESWACITDARLVDNLGMDTTAFRVAGRCYEEMLGLDHGAVQTLVMMRDPFWTSTLLVYASVGKQIGWFDEHLKYAEDHDFFLRLSLVTPFCFVNRLLCSLDRSKSPTGSVCRPWDDVDVRLRGSQLMQEKWLKLGSQLAPDVRKTIVHNIRCVHSAWANWYLEHKHYDDAKQAMRAALEYEVTAGLLFKLALTRVAPGVARRIAPRMRVN